MPAGAAARQLKADILYRNFTLLKSHEEEVLHRNKRSSRETDSTISKRDFRTAFDAFGDNQLVVWSNAMIPIRLCEYDPKQYDSRIPKKEFQKPDYSLAFFFGETKNLTEHIGKEICL